jgi:uncharacterized protein YukE
MAELGETVDPSALVPGDPEAARAMARSMTAYAGNLHEAGDGLAGVSTPEGWIGEAADAFRRRFALQPPAWQDAGDAFTLASRALDVYAETLDWAQRQAAEAARVFGEAQVVSQQAAASAASVDPGEAGRVQARDLLSRARGQLALAGDDAARTLDQAAAMAPDTGFWHGVGEVLGDVGDAALGAGRDVVNSVASVGNAALHHPADVAAMAGGAGLMLLGGAGELGGAALDATGVGAPAGVAVNVASAGLIVGGAGLMGAGAISVAMAAGGDDHVEPAGSGDNESAVGPPRPPAQRPAVEDARLDRVLDALYRGTNSANRTGDGTTADAIRWERASGGTVEGKQHIQKGIENIRALKRWLRQNPHASASDRGVAQNELNNLLEALGRTW